MPVTVTFPRIGLLCLREHPLGRPGGAAAGASMLHGSVEPRPRVEAALLWAAAESVDSTSEVSILQYSHPSGRTSGRPFVCSSPRPRAARRSVAGGRSFSVRPCARTAAVPRPAQPGAERHSPSCGFIISSKSSPLECEQRLRALRSTRKRPPWEERKKQASEASLSTKNAGPRGQLHQKLTEKLVSRASTKCHQRGGM